MKNLFIRLYHGASCEAPVFRSNADGTWGSKLPKYRFDTYGWVPFNFKNWGTYHSHGLCGATGYTNDLQDLIDAIKHMNERGTTACICDTLFAECVALGMTVLESEECPKAWA